MGFEPLISHVLGREGGGGVALTTELTRFIGQSLDSLLEIKCHSMVCCDHIRPSNWRKSRPWRH